MATNTRERAKEYKETRDKRPYATAKYIRISPKKVEIVLDLIRGKEYADAVNILKFTNKSASMPILKVLNSAAANAENNQNLPKDNLFVAECYAMQGPTMKRMMPRAKGRGDRILKRTSHIHIKLEEKKREIPTKPKAKTTDKKEPVKKSAATKQERVAVKPDAVRAQATVPAKKAPTTKKPAGGADALRGKEGLTAKATAAKPAKKEVTSGTES